MERTQEPEHQKIYCETVSPRKSCKKKKRPDNGSVNEHVNMDKKRFLRSVPFLDKELQTATAAGGLLGAGKLTSLLLVVYRVLSLKTKYTQ